MKDSKALVTAAIALVVALLAYFVMPSPAGERDVVKALFALGVAVLVLVAARFGGRAIRWIARLRVQAAVFALHSWAASAEARAGKDTLWDWFTDQLLVAQRRYAFSVGCIAFQLKDGEPTRCLMVERTFPGFGDDKVWLWPGGRIRGSLDDLGRELRQLVTQETGCRVYLLPVRGGAEAPFVKPIPTYNPSTDQSDLENGLLQPPIFVMQQNRTQSHNVPGHIDLLFLGEVAEEQKIRNRGQWLELAGIDQYSERQLWPDTRRCILDAAALFRSRADAATEAGPDSA